MYQYQSRTIWTVGPESEDVSLTVTDVQQQGCLFSINDLEGLAVLLSQNNEILYALIASGKGITCDELDHHESAEELCTKSVPPVFNDKCM